MKKSELLEYIKDINLDTEILINVGNNNATSKITGKYRGSFFDIAENVAILNFDEVK